MADEKTVAGSLPPVCGGPNAGRLKRPTPVQCRFAEDLQATVEDLAAVLDIVEHIAH